jgi:predicted nucleotidyltransferase
MTAEFPYLQEKYGLEAIGLFGSVSRGDDTPDSDVDVLYRFSDADCAGFELLYALKTHLEKLFGREVELVSMDYVDAAIRPYVMEDAILYDTSGKGIV